jgi:8-oxo-dGTP pyrophosphatase MutT (NUDIX family)
VTVRAGGGVVWRRRDRATEVLVVHRPKYDDWSLPKGKVEGDETELACALREVAEETGHRCEAGVELPTARYHDQRGRPKTVRYWAMRPLAGEFVPHREIDSARWVTPAEADAVLTYDHDRAVVRAFLATLAVAEEP